MSAKALALIVAPAREVRSAAERRRPMVIFGALMLAMLQGRYSSRTQEADVTCGAAGDRAAGDD